MHRFGAQLLAQLVDALPVGVFILDATGAALYANAEAQALLGRSPTEGDHVDNLGSRYAAYLAGTDEQYPTSRMPIARALAGERTIVDDMEVDRDGQRVLLEVTATPILDEQGTVVFAVAVFRDITAQRRLTEELERQVATRTRALEQALSAKSAFLMNVSHDLRTPLSHIIGFSELLAERTDDERSRRLATTAQLSALQLLGKIDNLIDLARVESEPADRQTVQFDFDVLLGETARASNLRFVPGEPLGAMRGDPQLIEHALRALVARASAGATMSAERDADGVRISIDSERLAHHVRALTDIELTLARARLRAIGGDLVVSADGRVELQLPRPETMHDSRDHEDS